MQSDEPVPTRNYPGRSIRGELTMFSTTANRSTFRARRGVHFSKQSLPRRALSDYTCTHGRKKSINHLPPAIYTRISSDNTIFGTRIAKDSNVE